MTEYPDVEAKLGTMTLPIMIKKLVYMGGTNELSRSHNEKGNGSHEPYEPAPREIPRQPRFSRPAQYVASLAYTLEDVRNMQGQY